MKNKEKTIKLLKYVTIGLAIFFLLELIYFGYKMINIRNNSTYYSGINSVIKTDTGYVAVGFSDKKHSKFLKYEAPGYNKPYIWVYDDDLKIVKEISLDLGYNGEFNDLLEVLDGYIVVGNIEMSDTNHKDSATEGVIIKYDKDFNIVWRKNYNALGDTKFNVVKEYKDSYFIGGSSIFESSALGRDEKGGAIILQYNKDGEKTLEISHGGATSYGLFNDIEIVDDGIIAVGVKYKGTGIIYKYDFKGKELWHNYFGYTDTMGLTSITKINNSEFVITASKLEGKDKTDNYQAALIKINNKGNIIKEEYYVKDNISRFNDSVLLDDKLYVVGVYGKKNDNILDNDSVIVTYDKSLEKQDETLYEGNKTYTLTKIIDVDSKYLVVGNTNSKLKLDNLKTNGLDFYQVIDKQ